MFVDEKKWMRQSATIVLGIIILLSGAQVPCRSIFYQLVGHINVNELQNLCSARRRRFHINGFTFLLFLLKRLLISLSR